MPDFPAARWTDSDARSARWIVTVRQRVPVTATVSALFLGGLLLGAVVPAIIKSGMLLPAALGRPLGWYRLLTYCLVFASITHWLVVATVTLVAGWLAERWLGHRSMCVIAVIGAVLGGVVYALLAPPLQPMIGGGAIAAAFAGAGVAATALRRHAVSRGAQVVALVLLLTYGLSPLRPDAQSLAMFAAFIAAAGYAMRRLRAANRAPSGESMA